MRSSLMTSSKKIPVNKEEEEPPLKRDRQETEVIEKNQKISRFLTPSEVKENDLEKVVNIDINKRNEHERDKRICRHPDERLHIYLLDGNPISLSGTEFKTLFFRPFNEDILLRNMYKRSNCETDKYQAKDPNNPNNGKSRREIVESWDLKRQSGTDKHRCDEMFLIKYADSFDLRYHGHAKKSYDYLHPDGEKSKDYSHVAKYMGNFFRVIEDLHNKGWKPFRTEWIIFDEDVNLAGCIDAVFWRIQQRTGQPEYLVVDWKTASSPIEYGSKKTMAFYPINNLQDTKLTQYSLQLCLYSYILETKYNMNVTDIQIIVFYEKKAEMIPAIRIDIAKILQVYQNFTKFKNEVITWHKNGECLNGQFPRFTSPLFFEE